MRIEKEYIKTGYFWLPEQQENRIPGILTIKDGGNIELEVVELFDESIKVLNGEEDLSRIIGYVEKDGLVTLDNCFYTQKNISFGGISKSKICVNRVLSGVAYDKNEKITFDTLSFSVDCLDEWVGISGINVENDWDNRTATITYKPPAKIVCSLNNGMKLEICFACIPPGFPNTIEAKITQRAYFKLSSEDLKPLRDFTEIVFKLTNFMCFAIDATVTLKNLIATSKEIQEDFGEGKSSNIHISIYYPSTPYSEKVPNKDWHQMLFNYNAIKTNMESIVNNWLDAYEILSPALSLYFSTKIGAQKYLDGKFLALVQGLEIYHRRTSDEKLMDEVEFKELVDVVKHNCPDEKMGWLEGRLMHGNEINLGKRLNKIIAPFKDYLGSKKERSKLLRKIVDTRNYLTHYSEELKAKSAEGKELLLLCQKMEAVFQLHFLKVLGFNDDEIENVIENCFPLKIKLMKSNKLIQRDF